MNSLETRHPQDPGGHAAGTPERSLDPLGSNFLAEAKGWYEVDKKKKKKRLIKQGLESIWTTVWLQFRGTLGIMAPSSPHCPGEFGAFKVRRTRHQAPPPTPRPLR